MNWHKKLSGITQSGDFQAVRNLLLLSLAVVLSFVFFISSSARSSPAIQDGLLQESFGREILLMNRLDRDRQTQLRLQQERVARQIQHLNQGEPGRLQESMGISIVHAAQKIQTDQKQLERSLEEARLNLSRFEMEKTGRFQEKLGLGVVRAFHRAPDPGPAFRSALQKEWGRLRKTEERIFFRLNNHLAFLMDRQKTFPQTIPLKFQEAVESAVRSEKMRGNAERAPMARALAELRADLKWQRTPEDYSRLTGGVLERLTGYRVAGGFVEYGLPSLLGIFLAMGWLGASLPKDHPLWRAGGFTEALQPDILYQKMKEVFTMPSNLTIFNWPQQTIFGPRASGEVGRYANGNNLRRAVVITDQGVHAENLSAQLTRSLAEARVQFQINTQARRDVADTVVEDINRKLKNTKLDLIVAIGGGSVIDTAKAVGILYTNGGNIREYEGIDKVQRPIPHLYAVPTTSGPGSEASKFCLVLDTGKKKKLEIVSSRIIPEMIFIDPLLATSMPPELTASCGMDALSNSVEAYFSTRANPLTDAKSIHALRLISESLRTAVANGKNLQAREKMALASFEAGLAFTNTHSGAVHALGHPLAGMFGIPEGVSNAILLPHVMRYSLNASLDRMVDVAEAMGETVWGLSKRDAAEKAIGAIKRLIVDIGLPTTLGKVGIKKDAIVAMSRQAQEDSLLETSPFVLKTRDIEQIYEDAFVEYPPPVFQAPPPVSPSTH